MHRLNRRLGLSLSSSAVVAAVSSASSSLVTSTSVRGAARRSFQPFSAKEEEELVHVLTTKPKHVARHIRQSVLQSTKNIAHFRNSVTYLMILLQSQLQKQEITPENAALVVEGIMAECVATKQADMAHLLFRAAVRFRKYGLRLSTNCVRILFESYRGNQARELMETLANELREDPVMRPIVMTAYIFAGQVNTAMEVKSEIPPQDLTTADFVAIIEGFGSLGRHTDVQSLVREAFEVQTQVSLPEVVSAAIVATRGTPHVMNELFASALNAGIPLSDPAISVVVRTRVYACSSLVEVYSAERQLREEIGTESLGLGAETAILSRCSELVAQRNLQADETMLTKVRHLHAIIETADDVEPAFLLSLMRGYGVLGKVDEMNELFEKMRERQEPDCRLFDEVLRWNSAAENVKGVIHYKEEMERLNMKHSTLTYINVFRCLDKFYPRMVEKYYNEMISKGFAVDAKMYPVLLQVFGDIGDAAMVEQLYDEMKAKTNQGLDIFSPRSTKVLLNVFRADEARCEEVIRHAQQRGLITTDATKHALMRFYSRYKRIDDLLAVADTMASKSPETYRVILRHYASQNERARFEDTLDAMRQQCLTFDDETVRVLITSYSLWGDAAKVRNVLSEAASVEGVHTALFYADAAAAFSRVGDMEAMTAMWDDLTNSKVSITMSTFNRFLDLFMSVNNMDKVQEILSYMMQNVPPNPVTATTVIDMLGKMGRLSEMEALLDEMSRSKNAAPTIVTYHQAMSAYAKVGDITKVEQIRQRMQKAEMPENAVTFNILVEAYGRAKRYEHIAELIQERRSKGIPMDEFGYMGLINTYARARMSDEVNDVVASLMNSSVVVNARLLSVIATAYSFLGDLPKVEHYVGLLLAHPTRRQRDVEAVFLMYSRLRDTKKLEELLQAYPRTEYVYNVCIGSFAKAGDYMRVATLLHEMGEKKMVLQRNTSITLSSLLLKAGKVELAHAVLNWKHHDDGMKRRRRGRDSSSTEAGADAEGQDDETKAGEDALEQPDEDVDTPNKS